MDYACVTSVACNKDVIKKYEVLQNHALRIIFKKTVLDHIKIEDLHKWANVTSVAERHEELLTRYYKRAIMTQNPLLKKLFENYKKFKERTALSVNAAVDADRNINLESLDYIL